MAAPPAARELHGKRKREQTAEEEEGNDWTKRREEEENTCPNATTEKTTPVRKVRGQAKGSQKLFASGAETTKLKGAGGKGVFFSLCF